MDGVVGQCLRLAHRARLDHRFSSSEPIPWLNWGRFRDGPVSRCAWPSRSSIQRFDSERTGSLARIDRRPAGGCSAMHRGGRGLDGLKTRWFANMQRFQEPVPGEGPLLS